MRIWMSALLVIAAAVCLSVSTVSAEETVTPKLILDGKPLAPTEPPQVVGSTTMVPVRVVSENLGFKVDYEADSKKVTVHGGNSEVVMTVGEAVATVDGREVELQAPPTAKTGTTLIPLRFTGEAFGLQVYWDNATKSAFLYRETAGKAPSGGSDSAEAASVPESGTAGAGSRETISEADPGTKAGDDAGDSSALLQSVVRGIAYEDNALVIRYDGKLEPRTTVLPAPDRIVVDLPGAVFATDFTPAMKDDTRTGKLEVEGHPALRAVRYSVFSDEPPTVRFVLDLEQPWHYGVTIDEDDHELRILLPPDNVVPAPPASAESADSSDVADASDSGKNPPGSIEAANGEGEGVGDADAVVAAAMPEAEGQAASDGQGTDAGPDAPVAANGTFAYTVVLDAGHGGEKDPGAISITKKFEKTFTLAVILKLRDILEKDGRIRVVLTRDSDTYPTLAERADLANSLNADLFLSVHGNSVPSPTPNGSGTYYTREDSEAFAETVNEHAAAAIGLKDNGVIEDNLYVTRETTMPAVLFEAGFLSNAQDEAKMYSDEFQDELAQGLADGIKAYLNLSS